MWGADFGGGITMPTAKPEPLPAASDTWAGGTFGMEDATASRRKALARLLMNGSGDAFDPNNPAFRTPLGSLGMAFASAIPAIAGMFGGGTGYRQTTFKHEPGARLDGVPGSETQGVG